METAVRNGFEGIVIECDGSLPCATCHVFLDKVPPVSEMEDEMLYCTTEDRQNTSRLSCQLTLEVDTEVHVATAEIQV